MLISPNPTIKTSKGPLKGYKAVRKDSNGYYTNGLGEGDKIYWRKGKKLKIEGSLELCHNGIHFFTHLCFAVNYLDADNAIFEVMAHGDILQDTFKAVTNDIEIVRKITKREIKEIIGEQNNSGSYNSGSNNSGSYNSGSNNSGSDNSGSYNSGPYNSGSYNSGLRNSGSRNSGYNNSGSYNSGSYNSGSNNSGYNNSGSYNSGSYNSGSYNSGSYNSGPYNSGSYNSGPYNSGSYNSGSYNSCNGYINYFCTKTRYFLFDIEINNIPYELKVLDMSWFDITNTDYKDAWQKCPQHVLDILHSIPEFNKPENKAKFKEITGINL